MHYLLKFGYDGRSFTGYQRGNGDNSVEDAILGITKKYGIADVMSSAARTDRGVSAAGNVLYLRSDMKPEKIIGILNAKTRCIIFHSYAKVDSDFRVRHSLLKHYRYMMPLSSINSEVFSILLHKFQGTHDFSLFSRKDHRSSVRSIERINATERAGFLQIDIYGPNFVWNQIRSIVGFARYFSMRSKEVDPFSIAKRTWPVAPAEALILMDISYKNVKFRQFVGNKKLELWKTRVSDLSLHAATLGDIVEAAGAPPS